tara:strand:+ start:182 stop:556 length:375 start_codon:yes stop_codon:yes gene_type:complete
MPRMNAPKKKAQPKDEWLPTPKPKPVNKKHLKILEDWIAAKSFDFKILTVEYNNVYDNRWRINVCTSIPTGQNLITERLSRLHGKSFFVTIDKDGNVIDRTTGRITEAGMEMIAKQGKKGKHKR